MGNHQFQMFVIPIGMTHSQKSFCWFHWIWVPADTAEGYSSGALQQQGFTIGNRL